MAQTCQQGHPSKIFLLMPLYFGSEMAYHDAWYITGKLSAFSFWLWQSLIFEIRVSVSHFAMAGHICQKWAHQTTYLIQFYDIYCQKEADYKIRPHSLCTGYWVAIETVELYVVLSNTFKPQRKGAVTISVSCIPEILMAWLIIILSPAFYHQCAIMCQDKSLQSWTKNYRLYNVPNEYCPHKNNTHLWH